MITWHIEKRKLSTLNPSQNNPRKPTKTGLNDLETSLTDIGLASPINIEINGNILSGHMRYEVLKKQGVKEIDVYVPDRELTQKEKDAVMIRMNKQIAGEWDIDALANNFELDDLIEFGFTEDELDIEIQKIEGKTDEDEVPEVDHPITRRGDIWLLGNHRLMCGDSTMVDDVEKLMNGEKAFALYADPPYGMNLDTDYSKMGDAGISHRKIIGDSEEFDAQSVLPFFDYCKEVFLWGADYYIETICRTRENLGSWIVWDKRSTPANIGQLDGAFGSSFELCWSKNKHSRDIARVLRETGYFCRGDEKKIHPTQKPVKLHEYFFNKWIPENSLLVDLFLGSGSTLIACEKTNRKCYGMEIDEKYCDVILQRFLNYSGKMPILESTNQTYQELKNERT